MSSISQLAVVICTRNRPGRIGNLLKQIKNCLSVPPIVLVVDSSDDKETEKVVQGLHDSRFQYLRSDAGLPHQRAQGVAFVSGTKKDNDAIVSFLDDDIEIDPDYFSNVLSEFELNPMASCIAGFDKNLPTSEPKFLEKIVFLRARGDMGRVLRSGIAIPPAAIQQPLECDWAPGHTLSFPLRVLLKTPFNERIRMYGEDVEFLFRVGVHGPIVVSNKLGVIHKSEPIGRDSVSQVEAYNAGARWKLAEAYPDRLNMSLVFISSLALMCGYFVRGIFQRNRIDVLKSAGLLSFFARLATGKRVTQTDYSIPPDISNP